VLCGATVLRNLEATLMASTMGTDTSLTYGPAPQDALSLVKNLWAASFSIVLGAPRTDQGMGSPRLTRLCRRRCSRSASTSGFHFPSRMEGFSAPRGQDSPCSSVVANRLAGPDRRCQRGAN